MAWISVHEQVIGVKLRSLAKKIGCSQNEALGLLVRFWLWGIYNATPDGRIESATKEDVADVLNIGIDKRYRAKAAVEAMINVGWIDIYDDCLYIHDWQEWQKQWYKAMRIRTFDTERKAREREKRRTSNSQESVSDISDNTPPPVSSKDDFSDSGDEKSIKPLSETTKKAKNDYPTDFEKFWEAYPKGRRIGKAEARKNYQARLNDGWTPEELIAAAKKYAAETERRHTEPRYIKHPKTFLSDTTPFTDYIDRRGAEAAEPDESNPFAEWE